MSQGNGQSGRSEGVRLGRLRLERAFERLGSALQSLEQRKQQGPAPVIDISPLREKMGHLENENKRLKQQLAHFATVFQEKYEPKPQPEPASLSLVKDESTPSPAAPDAPAADAWGEQRLPPRKAPGRYDDSLKQLKTLFDDE